MASIEICKTRLDAMLASDLNMFPISPSGEFLTSIQGLLLPKDCSVANAFRVVQGDINTRVKQMTTWDVCGIYGDVYTDPFVIAKSLTPVLHPRQIQMLASLILSPRKLQTKFDLFLDTVFGIEHPSEYNGGIFIDTPPTKHILTIAKQAFGEWGGNILFSNEP